MPPMLIVRPVLLLRFRAWQASITDIFDDGVMVSFENK